MSMSLSLDRGVPLSMGAGTAFMRCEQGPRDKAARVCVAAAGCGAAPALPLPGVDLALWSASLLELVLRYLDPADLARCSQACRRWYQAASHPELRARAFVRACRGWCPAGLDQGAVRRSLSFWCDSLVPGSIWRMQLEARIAQNLSPQAAFYVLAQERAMAARFAAPDSRGIWCAGNPIEEVVCSPDSRCLALCSRSVRSVRSDSDWYVNIWQHRSGDWKRVGGFFYGGRLSCLRFAADSRSLQGLGWQESCTHWQVQAGPEGDPWQSVSFMRIGRSAAGTATLSPDGRYIAVVIEGEVRLFTEEPVGAWRQLGSWAGRRTLRRGGERRRLEVDGLCSALVFSGQTRHLVFADTQGLRALYREHDRWHERRLEDNPVASRDGSDRRWTDYRFLFDVSGHLLAVARTRDAWMEGNRLCSRGLLDLWHFAPASGWHLVARHDSPAFSAGAWRFFMAFSPDGRRLAFAEKGCTGDKAGVRQLCILTVRAADRPVVATRLAFGESHTDAWTHRQPVVVQFNATGQYLLAYAAQGVQIWQYRAAGADWISLAWCASRSPLIRDDFRPQGLCRAVFSSDGFHCALTTDSTSVRILGLSGGQCREKVAWHESARINQLLFTPDGSSLCVLTYGDMGDCDDSQAARLHSLRLLPVAPPSSGACSWT